MFANRMPVLATLMIISVCPVGAAVILALRSFDQTSVEFDERQMNEVARRAHATALVAQRNRRSSLTDGTVKVLLRGGDHTRT